jgi:hypothetical protein
LSENGHFAYALAKFLDDQSRITLVRIDTATGETVASDIKYTDAEGDVYLPLIELLQPAVKSSVDSDYVFVAGNTHDTGIFQLVEFKPDAQNASVVWSRLGKVAKSASSVAHNTSMTLFGDGSLDAYPFDGSADPKLDESAPVGSAGALLADGPVPLFILYTNQDIENKLNELAEGLDMLDEKLDRERDEISNRLDAQDQKLDRDLGEVTKRLQEQDQKFDKVSTSLAEQRRGLAEVNEQISELMRPVEQPTNWVAWTAVFIGICSLLACWILTRKVRTG